MALYARRFLKRRTLFVLATFGAGMMSIFAIYYLGLNGPPIRSDGMGYYLYLPATLIHHDIGLQSVATNHFGGNIPEWTGATICEGTNKYLIKYPVGVALLMSPFFLLACAASFILSAKIDGFSLIFHGAAAVSGLFYATAGLWFLWTALQKFFKEGTVLLVLLGLLLGTNLFHYATYDATSSHAYSFFLFSAFLYLVVERISEETALRYLVATGAVAGLLVVTRPTNVIWLLVGLLYGVTTVQELRARILFWRNHIPECLVILLPFLGVVFIQLFYWKAVTGSFVMYSYRNESFNFLAPQIANVLFSIRKGLFFWAPILVLAIPGLLYLRRRCPGLFVPFLAFAILNVYVISSWHCWWYGGSFGHRAFVESTPLFAMCICAFYEGVPSSRARRAVASFTFFCIAISTWLMIKYWTGAIPIDNVKLRHLAKAFSNF